MKVKLQKKAVTKYEGKKWIRIEKNTPFVKLNKTKQIKLGFKNMKMLSNVIS